MHHILAPPTPLPSPPSAVKSRKNLTRFTYQNSAFEGWRLCISRSGQTFTKYFPNRQSGGEKKALEAAEKTLDQLKTLLNTATRINGKLSPACIAKAQSLLSKK